MSPPTTMTHQTKNNGESLQQRRLTKQRKLRYLSDQEAGFHSTYAGSSSLPASPLRSSSDHWSSSAVPQPLPLPESPLTRRPDHHHLGLGSPPFELHASPFSRKAVDRDGLRSLKSASNLGGPSFDAVIGNAKYDLRVNIPQTIGLAGNNSSCKDPREEISRDNYSEGISNLKFHSAAKSAPTSIFSSPVTSPRRLSSVDLIDPSINFHHDFNDILKVSSAKTAHNSPDRSPLRSLGKHSLNLNPTNQGVSQNYIFGCRVWPENNHLDAHPLPLPPRASPPAQSPPHPHSSVGHHTTENSPSMKDRWQKGKLIGRGSFGSVYHATNLETGSSCAMKEVDLFLDDPNSTDCIKQLEQEIRILGQLHHPNIVQYYGSEVVGDKLCIYMEYVNPGSLHKFMHEHCGAMTESVNLLLSRNDEKSVLKIADFGFARSLQPMGLAETLCGSPLYMAPEIMQMQKYDAKADLWSVGAILFQLVTGKTPFTGNNQIQLLQNIMKSTELQFPSDSQSLSSDCKDLCQKLLRRNPVERLTFEEFFNHPFLHQKQTKQDEPLRNNSFSRPVGGFGSAVSDPLRRTEENYQEDCLPFILDDDSSVPEGSPLFSRKKSSMKSTYGFDLNAKLDKAESTSTSNTVNYPSRYSSVTQRPENTTKRMDNHKISRRNLTNPLESPEQIFANPYPKVTDSLENIDQDYVLVSGPPMDISSSSVNASKPSHSLFRSGSSPQESSNTITRLSAPMPIAGVPTNSISQIGSSGSQDSAPGTSHGSMDTGDEQPSAHCMTRVKSLQECASVITELVNEKMEAGKQLEAFSIQLVILAIWKQALHICHTQAASAMEGNPNQEASRYRKSTSKKIGSSDSEECLDENSQGPKDLLSQIESDFLREFEHAEDLAKTIEPGSTEMPDAMETIFQAALAFGRHGGVEELMGEMESAAALYSKAVRLLVFLLVEAPSLILNPPFSLTNSDRYRLRNYIDILNNRQGYSRSQRMALLKGDDSQGIFKEKF